MVSSLPYADRKMTGTCLMAWMCFISSMPSLPGRTRSSRTRLGLSLAKRSSTSPGFPVTVGE